jgi:hypothetical protein
MKIEHLMSQLFFVFFLSFHCLRSAHQFFIQGQREIFGSKTDDQLRPMKIRADALETLSARCAVGSKTHANETQSQQYLAICMIVGAFISFHVMQIAS